MDFTTVFRLYPAGIDPAIELRMIGMMDRDTVFLPQQATGQGRGFPLDRFSLLIAFCRACRDMLHLLEKILKVFTMRGRNLCVMVYTFVINIQQGADRPVLRRDIQRECFDKAQEVLRIGSHGQRAPQSLHILVGSWILINELTDNRQLIVQAEHPLGLPGELASVQL